MPVAGGSSHARRLKPALDVTLGICLQSRRHVNARRCAQSMQPAAAAGCRSGCGAAAAADSAAGAPMRLQGVTNTADLHRADGTAVLCYSTPAQPDRKSPPPSVLEMLSRHAVGFMTCAWHHVQGNAAAGTHIRGGLRGRDLARSGLHSLRLLPPCASNRTASRQLHHSRPCRSMLSPVSNRYDAEITSCAQLTLIQASRSDCRSAGGAEPRGTQELYAAAVQHCSCTRQTPFGRPVGSFPVPKLFRSFRLSNQGGEWSTTARLARWQQVYGTPAPAGRPLTKTQNSISV